MKSIFSIALVLLALLPHFSTAQCFDWSDQDLSPSGTLTGPAIFDDSENLYVVISTFDSIQSAHGTYTTPPPNTRGFLIAKYSPDGNPLWAQFFETVDPNFGTYDLRTYKDRLYLTGVTDMPFSTGGFSINPSFDSPYLMVMDTAGQVLGLRAFTADRSAYFRDVEVDNSGNIIVGGTFRLSLDFGTTTLTKPQSSTGIPWGFFAKLDRDGNTIWAEQASSVGIGYSEVNEIEIGPGNEIYLGGKFGAEATLGGLALFNSTTDYHATSYVAKLDSNGVGTWADHGSGTGVFNAFVSSMGLNAAGEIYLATSLATNDTITWGGNVFPRPDGNVILTRHDANGTLAFSQQYTTTNSYTSLTSAPRAIKPGPNGKMWVAGNIEDSTVIGGVPLNIASPNEYNVQYYAIDQNDQIVDVKHFSGHPFSIFNGMAISNSGKKALLGTFRGSNIQFDNEVFNANGTNSKAFIFVDCDFATDALEARAPSIDLSLYPNPVANRLQIEVDFERPLGDLSIEVFDLYGRRILAEQRSGVGSRAVLELLVGDFPQGTYLVKLTDEKGNATTERFVKQ